MKNKIIVNGAAGKMGAMACKTIEAHPDFQLVAALNRNNDLKEAIADTNASIVIDFTRADCVYDNCLTIINSNVCPVIGTSGLDSKQIQTLTHLCEKQKLGGLIVPNFSIGAILMMHFATIAAKLLPEVEIIEMHHQQKLDAPSGTALKTAEMIANARCTQKNELTLKEIIPGARGATHHDIAIHSLRLPGVLAQQQVIFGNQGETLSITHNSIDRSSFMPGVILACQHVLTLNTLQYGLEHVINL